MVNWIPIVAATVSAVPAAAVFFAAYGRYDGTFRDNVVFLYFIGGLVLGGFLGALTVFLLSTPATLITVVGLALVYPIAVVAALNRRKWQGERHAIFNGGAAGLGVAVMLGFSLLYISLLRHQQALGTTDTASVAFEPGALAQALLLATGFAGLFFGLGLLAGEAIRRRMQFRIALLGTAILLAPSVFIEEYFRSRAWLWLILLAAYAGVFAVLAERKLMIQALTEEQRKDRRRRKRAERPT